MQKTGWGGIKERGIELSAAINLDSNWLIGSITEGKGESTEIVEVQSTYEEFVYKQDVAL